MSFWDDLTGASAADASKRAATDTYAKQQAAIAKLLGYGDEYAGKFEDLAKGYDPYVETGGAANSALMRLLQDPSSVRSLPGYQFALDEGLKTLDRNAAARNRSQGGRASKDFIRFAEGTADQSLGNWLSRLMAGGQYGLGALGAQNATTGQGLAGQLATRQAGFGGDMQAANTIGLGDIAAANAKAAGSQNLLNTGLKLGGMALGSLGFGGAFGQGGAFGASMPGFGGGGSSYGVPLAQQQFWNSGNVGPF